MSSSPSSSQNHTQSPPESEPEFPLFGNTEARINSFIRYLNSSTRILALCGAGLSASAPSNIPTFTGSGALWREFRASSLSSVECWEANPGLVWKYFADRRRLAIRASINDGHIALAELARKFEKEGKKQKGKWKKREFVCLTQNIDGLSHKAGHPVERLYELHGSLMDIKCSNKSCTYLDKGNTTEPLCPALAGDEEDELPIFAERPYTLMGEVADRLSSLTIELAGVHRIEPKKKETETSTFKRPSNFLQDIVDALAPTSTEEMRRQVVLEAQLPSCPKCNQLLRPGVVWFGEPLSREMFNEIQAWIEKDKKVDLVLVVGTRAEVWPAASFVTRAREAGARIAVIDTKAEERGELGECGSVTLRHGVDWRFTGDAAEVLRVLFEGILEN